MFPRATTITHREQTESSSPQLEPIAPSLHTLEQPLTMGLWLAKTIEVAMNVPIYFNGICIVIAIEGRDDQRVQVDVACAWKIIVFSGRNCCMFSESSGSLGKMSKIERCFNCALGSKTSS